MPSVESVKKSPAPCKILHMALPDEETRSFWKATAEHPGEYAARVARFSRVVGTEAPTQSLQSARRGLRQTTSTVRSRGSKPLGKVLIMPNRLDPH